MKNFKLKYRRSVSLVMCSILTLIFQISVFASGADTLKPQQKEFKRKAKISYQQGDVYKAINYYQQYLNLNHSDIKSMYRLANLYYETRDYKMAADYFDSVITKKPGKYPLGFYYKGVVLMNLEQYNDAENSFEEFRKIYRGHKDRNEYRRKARELISSSEWAELHADSVANVTITHLGTSVNGPHIEFSPVLLNKNTLVYGSLREDSDNPDGFRKLYVAHGQGGYWDFNKPFDNTINSGNFHTGNEVFSEDGKRMYFTRCERNWQNKLICSIYKSEFTDGKWQEPVKLPYPVNSDNFTTTQPALGNNLRKGTDIIYFVSDRPGGKGGLDIWYSEPDKRNGGYREPRDLGRAINTYNDECSPYYDIENRTLYFSSKGHHGFGGFDIMKSTGSRNMWTDAQTLPKPINSSYDDTYFSSNNGTDGFLTSNRPGSLSLKNGSCCDDIFYFKYNECIKARITGKVVNSTNYDVYDELNSRYHLDLKYPEDNMPLGDVPVHVYSKDSLNRDILVAQTKTDSNGMYRFGLDMGQDYSVVVKNYGYFDKRFSVSTKAIDCKDTINVGLTSINYIPEITVRVNVYYAHDKSKLTPLAKTTIDTVFMPLFDLFPNAIVEIGSHTDNTGSDSYNIKLSQRRSESVVNYLVSKGISRDRLVAKGYGESRPVVPNTNPDGSDNPENRQLNRRTELKIVGEISSFYIDE